MSLSEFLSLPSEYTNQAIEPRAKVTPGYYAFMGELYYDCSADAMVLNVGSGGRSALRIYFQELKPNNPTCGPSASKEESALCFLVDEDDQFHNTFTYKRRLNPSKWNDTLSRRYGPFEEDCPPFLN